MNATALLAIMVALAEPSKPENVHAIMRSHIEADANLQKELGFAKLTRTEQDAWFELLEQAFQAGAAAPKERSPDTSVANAQNQQGKEQNASGDIAYVSKVDSDDDDILTLDNGAIVKVDSGYLGFIGIRKTAILFREGQRWNVWIEGKRPYRCSVIREPQIARAKKCRRVTISDVKGDGAILVLLDGPMLKVDKVDTISTSLWLGPSEALLLDDFQLVNLNASDDPVSVMPLR